MDNLGLMLTVEILLQMLQNNANFPFFHLAVV